MADWVSFSAKSTGVQDGVGVRPIQFTLKFENGQVDTMLKLSNENKKLILRLAVFIDTCRHY